MYSSSIRSEAISLQSSSRLRLFCFAYAGGNASIFLPWSHVLSATIEVVPVQIPGRGKLLGEAPFTRLAPLIQWLVRSLRSELTSPFAFFGHSMGALVSFELARELRRQNERSPLHMFVSACRAPHLPYPDPPIHQLPTVQFLERVRDLEGTPPEVLANDELLNLLMPTLRADFGICETYRHSTEPPLSCPISIFGGLQDKEIKQEDLAAWHLHTSNHSQLRMLPGNHFFLHSARQSLLQAIVQDTLPYLKPMEDDWQLWSLLR